MAKFDTKAERVRYAIRKKYISEEDWTNKEIASELDVSPEVVSRYLNRTPQAEEVQAARSALEEEEWKQMVADLKQRIDRLAELERQLWEVVEPVVTGYKQIPAEAEIDSYNFQSGQNSMQFDFAPEEDDSGIETEVEVPIPDQWKEVPQFSRLRSVWDERRRSEEQLANILGLEAEDELNISGGTIEQKIYAVEEDEYPEQEVHKVGEEPEEEDVEEDGKDDE